VRRSSDHFATTQTGSLPRPDALIALNRARRAGTHTDEEAYRRELGSAVLDVVRRQQAVGIDVPGDGEYGKAMGSKVDYGAWWSYSFQRLGGIELGTFDLFRDRARARSEKGKLTLASFGERRDWTRFAAVYADPEAGAAPGGRVAPDARPPLFPTCTGPLSYTGQRAIAADIAHLRAALDACGVPEGFMTSIAPGSCSRIGNAYYPTDEEFLYACADAMREEYAAIVGAGLILQLDDPSIAENWDMIVPEPALEDYRAFTRVRIEALNHAIRGLPEDRIRFHLCWGSWHGPHTTDIPLEDIVDLVLAIRAQAYVFEAGNVRHEHEWRVFEDVKLPDGKILVPGVVSHATNVVEHPELVADRIERFARIVGRENVMAGTDCGLGGRIHPEIAWAKLEALAQGADLASRRLFGGRGSRLPV
jgi:5-methyltetrahydropteroyltriglutamate--homocysteine methyltransferase